MRWAPHSIAVSAFVLCAVGIASCFSPTPPTGVACAPGELCPPGQVCTAGLCQDPGGVVPPDDAGLSCGWKSRHLEPCSFPEASGRLVIDTLQTFDSDLLEFENLDEPPGIEAFTIELGPLTIAVLLADEIVIQPTGQLRIVGSLPVIFAAHTSVTIDGTVDLSNDDTGVSGSRAAGASPFNCIVDASFQALGGPGGSQRGQLGGAGGSSSQGSMRPSSQEPVGAPVLQGGCAGSDGGEGSPTGAGGDGADGGGGIYITAALFIEISGRIEANGGGGAGGGSGAGTGSAAPGGGGGGAGGHIILESQSIRLVDAFVLANGGGGGGGGAPDQGGLAGQAGASAGGLGGVSDVGGGRGGDGADSRSVGCNGAPGADGIAGMANESGGGGGGGACGQVEAITDFLEEVGMNTLSPQVFLSELPP